MHAGTSCRTAQRRLHDGRAATVRDLFVEPISHRLAEHQSDEQLEALVEYLLSL